MEGMRLGLIHVIFGIKGVVLGWFQWYQWLKIKLEEVRSCHHYHLSPFQILVISTGYQPLSFVFWGYDVT